MTQFEYQFYVVDGISFLDLRFENDVKMYGTQAKCWVKKPLTLFEDGVKMYGTQAADNLIIHVR